MSTEEQNNSSCCGDNALSLLLYAIGVGVVLLIGYILTTSARSNSAADEATLRGTRGVERKATRVDLEAKAKAHANGYGWRENFTNQITHIPVEKAMKLVVTEYANRDSAHAVIRKRGAIAAPTTDKDAKK